MITNITLENFKCFRKVSISPKLVTLFIGPNGTGKSGVLQALLLLKQSNDARKGLDLGGPLMSFPPEEFVLHGVEDGATNVSFGIFGYCGVKSEGPVPGEEDFATQLSYFDNAETAPMALGLSAAMKTVVAHLRIVPAVRGLSPAGLSSGDHLT